MSDSKFLSLNDTVAVSQSAHFELASHADRTEAVLYPINELDAWDQKNIVTCRASKRLHMDIDERA
jgi:hypothetical protein